MAIIKMIPDQKWLDQNGLRYVDFRRPVDGDLFIDEHLRLHSFDGGDLDKTIANGNRIILCPIESKLYPDIEKKVIPPTKSTQKSTQEPIQELPQTEILAYSDHD